MYPLRRSQTTTTPKSSKSVLDCSFTSDTSPGQKKSSLRYTRSFKNLFRSSKSSSSASSPVPLRAPVTTPQSLGPRLPRLTVKNPAPRSPDFPSFSDDFPDLLIPKSSQAQIASRNILRSGRPVLEHSESLPAPPRTKMHGQLTRHLASHQTSHTPFSPQHPSTPTPRRQASQHQSLHHHQVSQPERTITRPSRPMQSEHKNHASQKVELETQEANGEDDDGYMCETIKDALDRYAETYGTIDSVSGVTFEVWLSNEAQNSDTCILEALLDSDEINHQVMAHIDEVLLELENLESEIGECQMKLQSVSEDARHISVQSMNLA